MMMGGKGGGKTGLASKPNLLSALRIQTSSYGQVMPLVYGLNRIAGRLIWAGDFTAIPHTSTTKVGGKGLGSGGGNTISNTTYTYQTAIAMGLCAGPILNIINVWDTKGRLTLVRETASFTIPGGGGSFTPPGDGRIFHSPGGVARADSFSFVQNDYGSDGSVTFSGTQQTPMTQVVSSPGIGQFTVNSTTGVHTFSAADGGKSVQITYVYSFPDSNSNGQPQQQLSLTLFTGTRPQTAWSYLTSAHPGQDLGYQGLAYVAASAMDLGESGTLPNLSFEVLGMLSYGGGIADAEPSAIISDLITSPFYGLSASVPLGSLTQYKNFCVANGLFISPVLDAQKAASAWIQEILDITNAAAVWSEGVLKIIPYGDTTAVANGATFIPTTAPIYDLTTVDLLAEVKVKRPSIADVMNAVSVEWANRTNDYNPDVAEDKDDAMIAQYGLRKASPLQAHSITSTTVAKFVANMLRKRSVEIRCTYTFSVGWQFNLLECMDLVTLTIPEIGYNKKPVRITAMREDESGNIEIDAEDFPWGTATPTLYPHQGPNVNPLAANNDPGDIATPIIFEAPDRLSVSGEYELWMGVCGGSFTVNAATNATPIKITTTAAHGFRSGMIKKVVNVGGNTAANGTWKVTVVDATNFTLDGSVGNGAFTSGGIVLNTDWGGCRVWMSADGTNYKEIGRIAGPARMGKYSAAIGVWADPDQITISTVSRTSNVVTVTLSSNVQPGGFVSGGLVIISGVSNSSFNGTFTIATNNGTNQFTYMQTAANASSSGGLAQEALPVDLTMSSGALASGSQDDADNARTLFIISAGNVPELMSYQTATLTSASKYTLSYLRRGLFGTILNVHGANDTFLRLDDAVFSTLIDPTLVGVTLHFKFTSFNVFGLMEQSLANVVDYTFPFVGTYNNGGFASNNVNVDSILNGGACNIRIYGLGTNYLLWSESFDNSVWQKQTNVTVTPDNVQGPFDAVGVTTADTVHTGVTANVGVFQNSQVNSANGTQYTFSVWLKAGASIAATLFINRPGADSESLGITITTSWQRFTFTHSATWTGVGAVQGQFVITNANTSVFAWGAQLETGATANPYRQTTAVGITYQAFKPDGTTRSISAQTLTVDAFGTALAFSSQYYITFSIARNSHRAYLNYSDFLVGAANGEIRIGTVSTVSSGGTGGTPGGGAVHGGTTLDGGPIAGNLV